MISLLRVILVAMVAVVLTMVVWLVTPSSMFFAPVSMTLEGDTLTFVRDTPFGEVDVEWVGEISVINSDGFECAGSGVRIAQETPNGIVSGRVGTWARACLDAGPPFVIRYRYKVWLFGLIPLRPTGISTIAEGANT